LKSPEFIAALQSLNADLFVVVAFRMLPEVVWAMPAKGTLNIHASLLPQYRGAAPINHAIINGETESGLTTFMIDKEIDTGKIILQKKVAISRTDNAGDLHDRLRELSRNIIIETCEMLDHNQEQLIGQEELVKEALIHAPKIFKEHTKLNPNMSQKQAYNLIRGLSPYPSAYFELISPENEKMNLKVYATSPAEKMLSAGEIATDGKTFMVIGLSDGTLFIDDLQLQNKKRMQIEDFLRGFRLNNLWKWK
jgi:methionyl-tRNA formyltransferase